MLDTKIYNDSWFYGLSTESKLLFLFLISNDICNLIGCYELPQAVMLGYLSMTTLKLESCFDELKPKVKYYKGWVIIVNYTKYNPMRNPSIEVSQKKQLKSLPEEIYTLYTPCVQGVHTLCTESKETETETEEEKERISKGGVGDQSSVPAVVKKRAVLDKEKDPLSVIDEEYIQRLATEFKVPLSFVKSILDDLNTYINGYAGKKKKYSDYKLVLRNWVKKEALKMAGAGKFDPYKKGIDATNL